MWTDIEFFPDLSQNRSSARPGSFNTSKHKPTAQTASLSRVLPRRSHDNDPFKIVTASIKPGATHLCTRSTTWTGRSATASTNRWLQSCQPHAVNSSPIGASTGRRGPCTRRMPAAKWSLAVSVDDGFEPVVRDGSGHSTDLQQEKPCGLDHARLIGHFASLDGRRHNGEKSPRRSDFAGLGRCFDCAADRACESASSLAVPSTAACSSHQQLNP